MIKLLTVGTLVRRIEPPTNGPATVAAIDTGSDPPCYLLTYAEGGEGWWAADQIEAPAPDPLPPQPRWAEFGLVVMELPEVKAIFAQAIAAGEAPLAVGLGVALGKAADGQSALFLGIWAKAIAHGLVTPKLNGQVQALAGAFDLPADFVDALNP